jgi:hypothetical protein
LHRLFPAASGKLHEMLWLQFRRIKFVTSGTKGVPKGRIDTLLLHEIRRIPLLVAQIDSVTREHPCR